MTSRIRNVIAAIAAVSALLMAAMPAQAAVHTVTAGETLWSIAAAHGTSPRAIVAANGLTNPDLIMIGQRLQLPPGGAASPQVGSGALAVAGVVIVRPGDTLGAIAARTGTSVHALATANGIADPNVIRAGARLRVPQGGSTSGGAIGSAAATYTVRPGDTLSSIAQRRGTTVAALARANGIADPNVVRVGARLRIVTPTGAAAQPATDPTPPATPVTAASAGWGAHPSKDAVRAMIAGSSARFGVDPALVRAIAWQESGWWQGARSTSGAIGVMQLMPDTARWLGPALVGRHLDPYRAGDNIDGGAAYIAWLLRQAGSRNLAVASYYQGLSSVRANGMYRDTRAYVASVNRHYGMP